MEIDFSVSRFAQSGDWGGPNRRFSRVLLREPERCAECNRVYLSLYPLKSCADHQGLDEM